MSAGSTENRALPRLRVSAGVHAQEVQCSELSAEAQGSEMRRALLTRTPGITRSSTGLIGTETQTEKSLSAEGKKSAYTDSAQLRTVRCIPRQSLFYEVANYFNQILHFPKPLLYSFFSLLSIKPKQFWGKNK